MAEFKYIMVKVRDRFVPVIFPTHLVHALMFDAMTAYYIQEARTLQRPDWERPTALSAGSIQIDVEGCYGQSESLKVKAGANDALLIETYPYTAGILP
jgi:hypothetical protein